MRQVSRPLAALLLALGLAACQSGPLGALDPAALDSPSANNTTSAPTAAPVTIGSGPVRIAVLLPLSATGAEGERARSALDAMTLAASDLGGDALTVSVRDTGGAQGHTRSLATDEVGKRAAVVIGPSDAAGAAELSAIKGQKRPPFLTLASSGGQGPGTYALPLSEADSAAAALVAAIGEGKRHVALLIGEGAAAAEVEKRLSAAVLKNGGVIEARARYRNTPESIAAAVKAVADAESRPEVIVIANGSEPAAPLAAALSAAKLKPGLLIGTSAWTQADIASGSVEGALIASVDRSEMSPMVERFRQAYGREPQLLEAFAYDAMALSAGLARAAGEAGFALQNLTNPQGFRSTTGVFRLMPDGSVQRLLALHRVTKGKLKRVGEAQPSF